MSNTNNKPTYHLAECIDGEWYAITSCTSDYSANLMLAVLESAYPYRELALLSDRPKISLEVKDSDTYFDYRYELIRPKPDANKKPTFIVIDGGITQ